MRNARRKRPALAMDENEGVSCVHVVARRREHALDLALSIILEKPGEVGFCLLCTFFKWLSSFLATHSSARRFAPSFSSLASAADMRPSWKLPMRFASPHLAFPIIIPRMTLIHG
ncbi:unnamed protein product [Dicrocoelium dendriticum]|nr:unnamed protein product [Dicrocoelium dendriticum]